jgi:hypothetical protein
VLLIVVYLLVSWLTLREDRRDVDRRWLFLLDLGTVALGLGGLTLDLATDLAPGSAVGTLAMLRRSWWLAVPLLGLGMAVSFAHNVRRALRRPLASGAAERQAFWLLLGASAVVLLVDLAVLWVSLRVALGGRAG